MKSLRYKDILIAFLSAIISCFIIALLEFIIFKSTNWGLYVVWIIAVTVGEIARTNRKRTK